MLSITKIFRFEAAHCLPHHEGKCKNMHGHSYKLEVEIGGTTKSGSREGMIMDFSSLKNIVEEVIVDGLDHSNLNETLGNPTAENLVMFIRGILVKEIQKENITGCFTWLSRVRLWETATCYAEWRKE